MVRIAVVGRFLSLFISYVSAASFLKPANPSQAELESTLLSELAQVASLHATEKDRIDRLQSKLQPMYETVPKDPEGVVSSSVVRYVLHRFFAKRWGWYVRGLEPSGQLRNATRSAQEMQEWMPSYLQEFFEQVMGKEGFKLRELAIYAAIVEDFIHKEEAGWIKKVYNFLSLSTDSKLNATEVQKVIQTYWMLYNYEGQLLGSVEDLSMLFQKRYKTWNRTIAWLTRLQTTMWGADPNRRINFTETVNIAKEVGQHYGEFNDIECLKMKRELLSVESRKPGRVRLVDFYKKSLSGSWEFNEKITYLRALGALDESVPSTPLVIVPNYIASRTNCLTTSSFYSVCCRNECEAVLESLEHDVKTPHASPAQIVRSARLISSSTVSAPRTLSETLIHRLQEVAKLNDGHVPLHGRMFAQWLHHAFPRECPYPHEGGTTSPQTPDEWMKVTGEDDSKATDDEMLSHVHNDNCRLTAVGVDCQHINGARSNGRPAIQSEEDDDDLPWSSVEELLVVRPPDVRAHIGAQQSYFRQFVVFVLFFGTMFALMVANRPRISSQVFSSSLCDTDTFHNMKSKTMLSF